MSLSYLETELTSGGLGLKQRLRDAWQRVAQLKAEFASLAHEIMSSPDFRPAMLRVTSALAASFVIVRIAKYCMS